MSHSPFHVRPEDERPTGSEWSVFLPELSMERAKGG
jgi:hypothetical protein